MSGELDMKARITPLSDGSLIVVWENYGHEIGSTCILGQRITNGGVLISSRFIVNTQTNLN